MSSEDTSRHYKVMWLEPEKDQGKLSFVSRHRIVCTKQRRSGGRNQRDGIATTSSPFKVGQNVRVRWGKNSSYKAKIETIPTGDGRNRVKPAVRSRLSLGSSTTSVETSLSRKRRASEGTASLSSSQTSGDEDLPDNTPLESMINSCINNFESVAAADESSQDNFKWTKPSKPAPKRSKSLGGLFPVPSFLDVLEEGSVYNPSTLQDHERRRHADLRLRLLRDAENKLDRCFGMVRSLYSHLSVVEERRHLLPTRKFPPMTSVPMTPVKSPKVDIDKRQAVFEKRATTFYEMVQDIQELMADPEFKEWVAEAIVSVKEDK